MTSKTKLENLTIRLEPETRAALERLAEADRRSVSNLLRKAIADWTAAHATDRRERAA
jgi:predicted transcriptional regulator